MRPRTVGSRCARTTLARAAAQTRFEAARCGGGVMSTYVGQLDAARFVRPKAVAGYGFALGVVAFLAAIPPLTARSPVWPALLGILAAFAGVFAASRGARRAGWGAVVVGLLGVGLGVLATRSNTADLNQVFTASLIASM